MGFHVGGFRLVDQLITAAYVIRTLCMARRYGVYSEPEHSSLGQCVALGKNGLSDT